MSQIQKKIEPLNFDLTGNDSIIEKPDTVPLPPNSQMTSDFIKKVTNVFRINKSTEEDIPLDVFNENEPLKITPPKKVPSSNSNPNMKIVNVQVPKTWTPPIQVLELKNDKFDADAETNAEDRQSNIEILNNSQTQSSIGAVTKSAATISENHTLHGRISKHDLSEKGHSFDTTGFEIGKLKLTPIPSGNKKVEINNAEGESSISNSTSLTNIDSQTLTNIKLDLYNSGLIHNKDSSTGSKITNILFKMKDKFVPSFVKSKKETEHNLDHTYIPQAGEDTVHIALPKLQVWRKRIIILSVILLLVIGGVFYSQIVQFIQNKFFVDEKLENYDEPIENEPQIENAINDSTATVVPESTAKNLDSAISEKNTSNVASETEKIVETTKNELSENKIEKTVAVDKSLSLGPDSLQVVEENGLNEAKEKNNALKMADSRQENETAKMEANSNVTTATTKNDGVGLLNLKSQTNLGKKVKVNYKKLGRGLVYSCKKKSWSCVDKENFVNCKSLAISGNKSCKTVGVYKTTKDCKMVKLQNSRDKKLNNICQ